MNNKTERQAVGEGSNFMSVEEHFETLLAGSTDTVQALYKEFKNTRVETAYKGRNFVVYQMNGRNPHIIDRVTVADFECHHTEGASCEIFNSKTKEVLIVDYTPKQLFNHPVLVWLPLHLRIRWGATAGGKGSLGFPMCIRTKSHQSLRERDIVFCETGTAFGSEFGNF